MSRSGSDKSFHPPLQIPTSLSDQWDQIVPDPFLQILISLTKAEEFRSQSNQLKVLVTKLREIKNKEGEKEKIIIVLNAIFDIIDFDSQQEKPSHLPAELFSILRNISNAIQKDIYEIFIKNYSKKTIDRIEKDGHQFPTLQLLDILFLHKLWQDQTTIGSYYSILIDGCAAVLTHLCNQITTIKNQNDQSTIVSNSCKVEAILQIILRVFTQFKSEIKEDMNKIINQFLKNEKNENNQISHLFASITLVLQLDNMQQESITQAGLLLCQLFSFLEEDIDILHEQLFICFFPELNQSFHSTKLNFIEFICEGISYTKWDDFPIQSKLAVYRGLSIAIPGEILTKQTLSNKTILFDAIFPSILKYSIDITVPLQKLVAFQSIKNACLKLYSMVNISSKKYESSFQEATKNAATQNLLGVSANYFFKIFFPELVSVFWRTWEYHYDPVLRQVSRNFFVMQIRFVVN